MASGVVQKGFKCVYGSATCWVGLGGKTFAEGRGKLSEMAITGPGHTGLANS